MKWHQASLVGAVLLSHVCVPVSQGTTSDPYGVTEMTIAAGNVLVAPAYVQPKSFEGEIDSVSLTGSELTLGVTGTPFTSGSFDEGTYPSYYVEVITSGTYEGMYFDIVSNSGNQIVISTWEGTPQPLEAGNLFIVRKHMTLGDFFKDAEGSLVAFVDFVMMFYPGSPVQSIYWSGSNWTKNGVSNDSSTPVYPGQGLMTSLSSSITFTTHGAVKTTPTQVPTYADEINLVGTLSPLDLSFGELGTAFWMVPYVDRFVMFPSDGSMSAALSFYSSGTYMTSSGGNDDVSIYPEHSALLFLTNTDINWVQSPAYSE